MFYNQHAAIRANYHIVTLFIFGKVLILSLFLLLALKLSHASNLELYWVLFQ